MINAKLLELTRCPTCIARSISEGRTDERQTGTLVQRIGSFVCQTCHKEYPRITGDKEEGKTKTVPDDRDLLPGKGYLDLMPVNLFEQNTLYLEDEFEEELDHQHISLPFLGAAVRNDLLRKMLKPSKNDIALEVGCGNGKFCFWNRQLFGTVVGVDAATLFAEEALEDIPLVRGDVRLLPFAPASFDKIFSIDLLEHLPASGIAPFFSEINRVLKPGGLVFIFSNTREKGKLWPVISFEKRVAGYFVQKGIFDFKRDELRKSDHIKAITTFEELEDAVKKGGFRLEQKVFWNGVFQGLVDNIIIKGGEYLMRRRVRRHLDARKKGHNTPASRLAAGTTGISSDWADGGKPRTKENEKPEKRTKVELEAEKVAEDARRNNEIDLAIRRSMKRQIGNKKSGGLYYILSAFTSLMKLDIRLFGKMRTGPYFILIRKTGSPVSK